MPITKCAAPDCKSFVDHGDTDTPLVEDLRARGWQTIAADGVTRHYCQAHKDPAVRTGPLPPDTPKG